MVIFSIAMGLASVGLSALACVHPLMLRARGEAALARRSALGAFLVVTGLGLADVSLVLVFQYGILCALLMEVPVLVLISAGNMLQIAATPGTERMAAGVIYPVVAPLPILGLGAVEFVYGAPNTLTGLVGAASGLWICLAGITFAIVATVFRLGHSSDR